MPWAPNDGYEPKKLNAAADICGHAGDARVPGAILHRCLHSPIASLERSSTCPGASSGPNILFLYTSDHGAQWPFSKWNLYDAGIRTPFIAAWPGVIQPGARSDAMVQWIDLLPTLIEFAGGKPPEGIDGRSFADVLRGKRTTHRDVIYTTHSGDGTMNVYPIRALRTRRLEIHPESASRVRPHDPH